MTEEDILKYSNLIYKMTHYFNYYDNKDDLYQAGIIGLLEASKKYDKSFNTKFSTFAFKYIYGEMSKLVREDKNIKVSRTNIKLKQDIEKVKEIMRQKLYREPTDYEISEFLNIDIKEIEEALKITNTISLDEVISNEEKEITYHDLIGDNIDLDTRMILKESLESLNDIERKIIIDRTFNNYSQSEVAQELGLSQVKVSREEQKIKKKLKNQLIA